MNIILRDHFDGAETQVHYGGTAGGRYNVVASQLMGTHWDGGNVMFVYQYSDASALPIWTRGYAASANKAPYGGGNYQSFYADPGNILNPSTQLPLYGGTTGTSATSPQLSSLSITKMVCAVRFVFRKQHSTVSMRREGKRSVLLSYSRRDDSRSVPRTSPGLPDCHHRLGPQ